MFLNDTLFLRRSFSVSLDIFLFERMEIKLAAFLITLVAAVSALSYEQQCVPSVYKSDFLGQFGQTSNGQSMVLSMVGTIYFDFNTKKEVAIQTIKGDGFTLNQTYFRDRSNVSIPRTSSSSASSQLNFYARIIISRSYNQTITEEGRLATCSVLL